MEFENVTGEPEIEGIEFVEYATARPKEFGVALQAMGFRPVARHRSRDVLLYRQGDVNVIVNADPKAVASEDLEAGSEVMLKALAIRVPDAGVAYTRALACGGQPVPSRAGPMELTIPGIQGPGGAVLFLLDRRAGVSFYEVDFLPLADAQFDVPALSGLHFFGIVQYILAGETDHWCNFYERVLGFAPLPEGVRFGVLPRGAIIRSACGRFFLQFIEPPAGAEDAHWREGFNRVGLGVPDVEKTVAELESRGIHFVDSSLLGNRELGALTRTLVGGTQFELVHHRP
ncbi:MULTISPECIES: VOC family protein [Zoogloea]|jgi:4-hydroxyphenylpyruvate dioxygenase|uniref:4-hydroxyphenylpyruvate dioxygenase n=1 Tax=Zoogloea oleivorans TaxID=1552750 RepID=A0A6C2CEQ8_9RHOO|nr:MULTISPECIES: VOC family protein [Zoogloea]MBT9498275.1 4-hydroxyphenylpyruvate dioxygenase [Zoogloea sp.]MDD2668225.1 4-hydroxyphenylpyruvate dioxygenase [Zoogloea sp.]MDY0037227.1 4-hydroxyphenylpyruvate dioxygenase [Zoogloea oleivorans]TYC51903.1 4-hydroxyphenylpyruvate dioxygenase [Zoogloea oleivorans]